ncbi:MAG: hypothetical protein P4L30_11540 [Candidatus Limnocylindrales bacterium]|jgi:hypothetical protein|nr:hypothetical protein [Candidatus Limnocylindrales bacterium]
MSDQTIKLIAAGVLLVHGLGHGGALGALAWIRLRPGASTGDWAAARSWLIPSLSGETATAIASAFWVASLVGFVVAAMSFWGVAVPGSVWRPLAVAAALVSTTGIVAFFGTWPLFNTFAALGVNVAVLVAVLWLRWPTEAMLRG